MDDRTVASLPSSDRAPQPSPEPAPLPSPAPSPAPPPTQDRAAQLVKAITGVTSLLALLSGLLYYFGWVRSETQAQAFGADASVFAMTAQDLVLRSADVLFLPLIAVLLLTVLAMVVHARLVAAARQPAHRVAVRRLARLLGFTWLVALLVSGVLLIAAPTTGNLVLPFLFAAGIAGTWYSVTLRGRLTPESAVMPTVFFLVLAALIAVSAFWMTERVARVGAQARVQAIQADVSGHLKGVAVYSADRLELAGANVHETQLPDPKAAYRYRYDGLYLLQRSGGSYFLVSDGWTVGAGRLVVLPESGPLRLEFGPGR